MRRLLGATLLALACASPVRSVQIAHTMVTFDQPFEELPFDPDAPELTAASRRLEKAAGHPIRLDIDAELVDSHGSYFPGVLVESLGNAARDFERLAEHAPGPFAESASLIEVVRCRQDRISQLSYRLDAVARTLTLLLPPDAGSLLPLGVVYAALRAEHVAVMERRFAGRAPGQVPPAEKRAYFEFVTGYRTSQPRAADPRHPDELASDPHADTILRVARIHADVRDPALSARIVEWLLQQGPGYFVPLYRDHPRSVAAAGPSSLFRQAEAAWIRWLDGHRGKLDPREQLAVAELLFSGARGAFGAVDRFAYGLPVVDAWIKANHPRSGEGERQELFQLVVCPDAASCAGGWYQAGLASAAGSQRFAQLLLLRRDPQLTEVVLENLLRRVDGATMIRLWRALGSDPEQASVASRVLADGLAEIDDVAPLADEASRLWREEPTQRGVGLWLLSHLDGQGRRPTDWLRFAEFYGAKIDQAAFEGFLDHGGGALGLAHRLWPALELGWSRTDVLASRLDGYLDGSEMDAVPALLRIFAAMCAENNKRDLAKMHARLLERVRAHKGDAERLAEPLKQSVPARCK